jgi:hypothetical protein
MLSIVLFVAFFLLILMPYGQMLLYLSYRIFIDIDALRAMLSFVLFAAFRFIDIDALRANVLFVLRFP